MELNNEKYRIDEAKEEVEKKYIKNKKNKLRMKLVLLFVFLVSIVMYFFLRGSYLEYLELGNNYVEIFKTNLELKTKILIFSFLIIFSNMFFINLGIKKGLTPFFEKEKVKIPKLINKSISLVIAVITSIILSNLFAEKIMMFMANTSFGGEQVLGFDISYYMFQKPLIEAVIYFLIIYIVMLTIYISIYYVVSFNIFFEKGVEGTMIKKSRLLKTISKNIIILSFIVASLIVVKTQDIVYGKILEINDEIEIIGAGITENNVQYIGYIILAVLIVICTIKSIRHFKKEEINKVIRTVAVIPTFFVIIFISMVCFDIFYAKTNELDKETVYLERNISYTKDAYNINIEEISIENSGDITSSELEENENIINNIPIISEEIVLETINDSQTNTGYYTYNTANAGMYEIDGLNTLLYISPREITIEGRTYNAKTFEYTHGIGAIFAYSSETTTSGAVEYLQKTFETNEINTDDVEIEITESRIYYGTQNDQIVVTNIEEIDEYDYTNENGEDITNQYEGDSGISLGFLDRVILSIYQGNLSLIFQEEVNNTSNILINRNILDRVKTAMPYLTYDNNPYMVIDDDGNMIWVIDAYTTSSNYPYSQYIKIESENDLELEEINYIRNSIKVLVNAYTGEMKFYITDRDDPIAMAYQKIYPTLFMNLDEEIPEDISSHFIYPQYLYDIQAEVLEIYHDVKAEVLYRADDIWSIAQYNSTNISTSSGSKMDSYYAITNLNGDETLSLIQMYTQSGKQSINAYLIGNSENGDNELVLYKFKSDSNVVGPMQLETQIAQDETIQSEIAELEVSGTKITKDMIIIPINNTLLYIEPIYQTKLNETSIPILKKVIVASESMIAIGDTLEEALKNLLSENAVDIEIQDTETIEGLIEAIIKANTNLEESLTNNDWSLIGSDIQKLQELINTLEEVDSETKNESEEEAEYEEQNNEEY